MKNVIFKALFCLIPFAFVACGDDSSSNAGEFSDGAGASALVPGKCIIKKYAGLENVECVSFSLNEADSVLTYVVAYEAGSCSGPDDNHLAWKPNRIKLAITYRYSIHGDTLIIKSTEELVGSPDEKVNDYDAESSGDTLHAVDVFVSDSHRGILGTWEYVTSYHEDPHTYVNPFMNNVLSLMSVGEDSFLMEEVPNSKYSFGKSILAQTILFHIGNNGEDFYSQRAVSVGYLAPESFFDSTSIDVKAVAEDAEVAAFKVNGKSVVFSNIKTKINYFRNLDVSFDLEYDGKTCSFHYGFEQISEKTCKSELVDNLKIYHDYDDDYETVIGAEADEYIYADSREAFWDCLGDMVGLQSWM